MSLTSGIEHNIIAIRLLHKEGTLLGAACGKGILGFVIRGHKYETELIGVDIRLRF